MYKRIDPNTLAFGPFAYTTVHLTRKNATRDASVPLWPYKYDSTSISMRAVAKHLNVPTWSPCLLYETPRSACNESQNLPRATVFAMIDGMIDGVRDHQPIPRSRVFTGRPYGNRTRRSGHLTLRLSHRWVDRLYDLILPEIFERIVRRSSRAIYYDQTRLKNRRRPICSGNEWPRPINCGALWTKIDGKCSSSTALCTGVDNVWSQLARRLRFLRKAYPNMTMDMALVEGAGDFSRGGFTYHGRRWSEVVAFTRLRECKGGVCTTVAVDDYRFQCTLTVMSVLSWYAILTLLRAMGQFYAWSRLLHLMVGVFRCHFRNNNKNNNGNSASSNESLWLATRRAIIPSLRTFFMVPSQIVIYGSAFPITCYIVAHVLDSSAVYEVIRRQFSSPLGAYSFELREVVTACAVSMRSAWVFAVVCHILQAIRARRSWGQAQGIPGIPEFFVTTLASTCIFAQTRALSWRDTRVSDIHEVVPSGIVSQYQSFRYDTVRSTLNNMVLGSSQDVQFLSVAFFGFSVLTAVSMGLHRFWPAVFTHKLVMVSRTMVPFSANALWPTNALVVSWQSTIVVRATPRSQSNGLGSSRTNQNLVDRLRSATRLPPRSPKPKRSRLAHAIQIGGRSQTAGQLVFALERRTRDMDAMIFLVNLTVMTDPITLLSLRFGDGQLVGLFSSKQSKRLYFLPFSLLASTADTPIEWDTLERVAVFQSRELTWLQLLHIG
ncbi:hypothetical protein PINS_up011979 [Pythium insidiosum]|nr:hypothetical protein PINS_up011979 [Pythium insidiosum]